MWEAPDSLKRKQIIEVLDHLSREDFSLRSITDGSRLELLLDPFDIPKAEEEAYRRFVKYIRNRVVEKGANFDAMARKSIREGIRIRVYLDMFIRSALCHLGIAGSERINYNRLAYKLVKRLKGKKIGDWPQVLEKAKEFWEDPVKLDPRTAKIVTVLAAKVYYQLLYGKLRLGKPTKGELYPEHSDVYREVFKRRRLPRLEESKEQPSEVTV